MYKRTTTFAVRVIRMIKSMPRGICEDSIAKQLTRSATSIGANYREACHAKSTDDFAYKLKICEAEADETYYWLELLVQSDIMPERKLSDLMREAQELVAILTAATKTTKNKSKIQNSPTTMVPPRNVAPSRVNPKS